MSDAPAGDKPDDKPGPLPQRHVTINQLVGYNVNAYRRAAGLSQGELGARLGGWSAASVSAAERSWDGRRIRKFDADEVAQLAGALGVPVIALLLPPPDAGTAVTYTFDVSAATSWGLVDMMSHLVPSYEADDGRADAAFRDRIIALGASRYDIDPIAGAVFQEARTVADEVLARARSKAGEIVIKAQQQAEQVMNDARARGETLDMDPTADARTEADEVLRRARTTADEILTKARRQAEQVVSDTRARCESLERDVQERHRVAMGQLVPTREELERRVDDLRTFEREYRSRLLAYLEGQIRDLQAGAADADAFPPLSGPGSRSTDGSAT